MSFATCLNCMDGRVQEPLISWIKENSGVEYVDMITEAGIVGIIAKENSDIESILKKIDISLEKHGSKNIFVSGHYDCAGNPVEEDMHKQDINNSVERIKKLREGVGVVGLWVDDKWKVEKIT